MAVGDVLAEHDDNVITTHVAPALITSSRIPTVEVNVRPRTIPAEMRIHGPWQIVESHDIYRDPWISVRKDDVIRPDGQPGTHSVVVLKPGVTVLAMDDEGNAYLREVQTQ